MKIEVVKSHENGWSFWRIISDGGKVLASSDAIQSHDYCVRQAMEVAKGMPLVEVGIKSNRVNGKNVRTVLKS